MTDETPGLEEVEDGFEPWTPDTVVERIEGGGIALSLKKGRRTDRIVLTAFEAQALVWAIEAIVRAIDAEERAATRAKPRTSSEDGGGR
ncbi:hypothetical protein [Paludisphaera mucosa]|uniref:Uncharacterized protein n=1 Tax=Paludisphaera mucosa TaxID=3030827 RepID=A0ABT6F6T9_9BACT|nr:hypothetical protein [Paludisphaera mucosa]MDG3003290.1 hypothetical protein [Paludisphaera mucosa]